MGERDREGEGEGEGESVARENGILLAWHFDLGRRRTTSTFPVALAAQNKAAS